MQAEEESLTTNYHDMQSLSVRKASEEGRHHLDVIGNSETHVQTQNLDAGEHGTCPHLYPWLKFAR
jgi:hypothetical protein